METLPNANIGSRLAESAERDPDGIAVSEQQWTRTGKFTYRDCTFRELEEDSKRLAGRLQQMGVVAGARLVLLVPPGIDFIALAFAVFKSGAVAVLIDPGMGRDNLLDCLEDVTPDGFIAVPKVQLARVHHRSRFPKARFNVTVGAKWFTRGPTLRKLRRQAFPFAPPHINGEDPAAIIFTSGSTGVPKGVLYCHRNFEHQIDELRNRYQVEPGEVDVACFPLFALFDAVMGVTAVIPDMDFTKPADVDPDRIVAAVHDRSATQAFGSPSLWNTVGRRCEQTETKLPTLKRILSAGAPVPPHVLRRMTNVMEGGEMFTPYGATEALPVASISSAEVLGETEKSSIAGAGTCVGTRFPGIEWRIIRISDDPLPRISDAQEVKQGEIGELIVRGPVVTREYVTQTQENKMHKIRDGETFWHRMGDVGYLDARERFWFCGRKSHRVTGSGVTMFTIPCEAILNQHERVYRSALVGLGTQGIQRAVMIVELLPECALQHDADRRQIIAELWDLAKSHRLTRNIREILLHPALPVDIRHNAKIFREQLAEWAKVQRPDL